MGKFNNSFQQLGYLKYEASKFVGPRWWRSVTFFLSDAFIVVAVYRLDRSLFLLLGNLWVGLRIVLSPVSFLFGPWIKRGHCTIDYRADIGPGIKVLHPELGILVTGYTVAGKNLILTGGNLIGSKRRNVKSGDILIGDDVLLGANAVVLGPIKLGNNVKIGAGSVALDNSPADNVLFGVPAKSLFHRKGGAVLPPVKTT